MHTASSPGRASRRRRRIATGWKVAGGVAAVVAVLIAVLWITVLPEILGNLGAETAEVDTPVALSGGPAGAEVVVPAGWSWRHPLFDERTLVLRTPDGALEVRMAVVPGAGAAAYAAAAEGLSGLTPPVTETITSGRAVVHASSPDVLLAAVEGDTGSVTAIARPRGARPLADYLPTVAALLTQVQAP